MSSVCANNQAMQAAILRAGQLRSNVENNKVNIEKISYPEIIMTKPAYEEESCLNVEPSIQDVNTITGANYDKSGLSIDLSAYNVNRNDFLPENTNDDVNNDDVIVDNFTVQDIMNVNVNYDNLPQRCYH
jgi:hypothetical protein